MENKVNAWDLRIMLSEGISDLKGASFKKDKLVSLRSRISKKIKESGNSENLYVYFTDEIFNYMDCLNNGIVKYTIEIK